MRVAGTIKTIAPIIEQAAFADLGTDILLDGGPENHKKYESMFDFDGWIYEKVVEVVGIDKVKEAIKKKTDQFIDNVKETAKANDQDKGGGETISFIFDAIASGTKNLALIEAALKKVAKYKREKDSAQKPRFKGSLSQFKSLSSLNKYLSELDELYKEDESSGTSLFKNFKQIYSKGPVKGYILDGRKDETYDNMRELGKENNKFHSWCIFRSRSHLKDYSDIYYMFTKGNQPYLLTDPESKQIKDAKDESMNRFEPDQLEIFKFLFDKGYLKPSFLSGGGDTDGLIPYSNSILSPEMEEITPEAIKDLFVRGNKGHILSFIEKHKGLEIPQDAFKYAVAASLDIAKEVLKNLVIDVEYPVDIDSYLSKSLEKKDKEATELIFEKIPLNQASQRSFIDALSKGETWFTDIFSKYKKSPLEGMSLASLVNNLLIISGIENKDKWNFIAEEWLKANGKGMHWIPILSVNSIKTLPVLRHLKDKGLTLAAHSASYQMFDSLKMASSHDKLDDFIYLLEGSKFTEDQTDNIVISSFEEGLPEIYHKTSHLLNWDNPMTIIRFVFDNYHVMNQDYPLLMRVVKDSVEKGGMTKDELVSLIPPDDEEHRDSRKVLIQAVNSVA